MVGSKGKKIDHLTEDAPIPGQRFVCLSFVSPEGVRNCTTRGLKVRGVFATYEEAQERCKELQLKDPDFDIFVGEVGKWCPWDPDPNSAKDQKYQEEELQKLVEGYKDNLNKATKLQEQRKREMIENAAREEQTRLDKTKTRLRKKLEKKKAKERMESLAKKQMEGMLPTGIEEYKEKKVGGKKKKDSDKTLTEIVQKEKLLEGEDELAKEERDRLHDNYKKINEQQTKVASIDNQLDRIQSLYNKLKQKQTNA